MSQAGVITTSTSSYSSPTFVVPKAMVDGVKRWRMVTDFRELNASMHQFGAGSIMERSWVRRFIPHYAKTVQPLVEATKKHGTVNAKATEAFATLKEQLLCTLVTRKQLSLPNFEKPLYISTDASSKAIGGFIYQLRTESEGHKPDNVLPLAFLSRTLSEAERKYHDVFFLNAQGGASLLTEALAVLYVLEKSAELVEQFEAVIVNTDHRNLLFLRNQTKGMLFRWSLADAVRQRAPCSSLTIKTPVLRS
eukprot:scaffold2506_cov236-Pinguiococcus_pyrenoidosus.AAC.14